jgi:hypothetical protein
MIAEFLPLFLVMIPPAWRGTGLRQKDDRGGELTRSAAEKILLQVLYPRGRDASFHLLKDEGDGIDDLGSADGATRAFSRLPANLV